jgi:selenocysteine lyase/cysteine desulfurase
MKLDRRAFLQRAATGGLGLVAAGNIVAAEPPAAIGTLPAFDARQPEVFWAAVRSLFPLTRDLTYFNTGGLGPTSEPALAVVAETTRRLQVRSEHGHEQFAAARGVVAKFLGATAEEIAFVRNATEGNAIVAAGVKLDAGDEVIFETHAHPGGSFPWVNQQALRGVKVRLFDPDTREHSANVAKIAALITPRTRVLQVSHITAPTGIVLPVIELARLCREKGIWFHVDGAQSAGMIPVALREMGCDSYATSGHKWLNGPLETGILFVRRERVKDLTPTLVGAYSGEVEALPGELRLADTAVRFEYGTRNPAAVLGLVEAMRLQERIGLTRIAERGRAMVDQIRTGLAGNPDIEILTPRTPGMYASMITFRSRRAPFDQLFGRLLREHAIRARPVSEEKLNALRVSTHVFNSPAECDALIAAVNKIVKAG